MSKRKAVPKIVILLTYAPGTSRGDIAVALREIAEQLDDASLKFEARVRKALKRHCSSPQGV